LSWKPNARDFDEMVEDLEIGLELSTSVRGEDEQTMRSEKADSGNVDL